MFKPQLSPRSIHPYQTTMVPRTEQQLSSATQHRTKYPWTEETAAIYQYHGTDSSTSDPAYNVPQYYNANTVACGPPSPVYQSPYSVGTWRSCQQNRTLPKQITQSDFLFPQCASAFSLPLCDINTCTRTQNVDHSPVPPMPSVSPEVPIIGACGGHCPGFEYVCYYILQVIFVVGILTGISLCIAGIVLRRTNRNGDLGVLVYIGCLSSCVCGVLLGVQCCVRREIRQRKQRANLHIPLQPIVEVPLPGYPLLAANLPQAQTYRPPTINEDVTGVPWWRRE